MPEPASELVADRDTELPETVEPSDGAVRETDGAIVSMTIFLFAERLRAGVKLVMGLLSVEVIVPATPETFRSAVFSPDPTM